MTLRRRMILLAAGSVAVAICIAAVISYVAVRGELRGQVDDRLRGQVEALEELSERVGGLPRLDQLPDDVLIGPEAGPSPFDAGAPIFIQRISPEGETMQPPPFEQPIPVSAGDREIAAAGRGVTLADTEIEGEHVRAITAGVGDGGAVQITASLEGSDEILANLRVVLILVILGGCALAGILARRLASRAIAPITELTDTAEHIGETEDLSRRIVISGDDEIGRLAARFNSMLETLGRSRAELSDSVAAQRRLVADASHELRTPVASARTDIEVLRENAGLPEAERARILASVDERIEELGDLITDVIELARGDAVEGEESQVRLDLLVVEGVDRARRHAPSRRFEVSMHPVVVSARPDRLARAVNNLLDNAVKFSPAESPVEVVVNDCELLVRDHGPGIPQHELERVFDRFHRGANVRETPGSGLGLAIAKQVAEAHGGSISVANAKGGGAVFRLSLPKVIRGDHVPV